MSGGADYDQGRIARASRHARSRLGRVCRGAGARGGKTGRMARRVLVLLAVAVAAGGAWLAQVSGQWHYLAVVALAPILWLSGRG